MGFDFLTLYGAQPKMEDAVDEAAVKIDDSTSLKTAVLCELPLD